MSIDTIAVVFGVFSAVANIVIAFIAARGRWWEKAEKIAAFMDEMRQETSSLLHEMGHVTQSIMDMKAEYKDFTKTYSIEVRELQAKVYTQEHRISEIERRLNTK